MYYNLLNQKKFPITMDNKEPQFGLIFFDFSPNELTLKFNGLKKKIILPSNLNFFFQTFFNLLQDFEITLDELKYNPIKETLSKNKFSLKLRNTHNYIIRNALIYKNLEINKFDLYREIWPNDIDLQINKLDTHLTNLKNLLLENFGYKLSFKSIKGKIIFSIN